MIKLNNKIAIIRGVMQELLGFSFANQYDRSTRVSTHFAQPCSNFYGGLALPLHRQWNCIFLWFSDPDFIWNDGDLVFFEERRTNKKKKSNNKMSNDMRSVLNSKSARLWLCKFAMDQRRKYAEVVDWLSRSGCKRYQGGLQVTEVSLSASWWFCSHFTDRQLHQHATIIFFAAESIQ